MSQPDSNQPQKPQSSVAQSQTAEILSKLKNGANQALQLTIRLLDQVAGTNESESANSMATKFANITAALWAKFLPIWNKLLTVVRGRLSPEWNTKLGDRALSGILAGAIFLLFWFTTSLFSPSSQVSNRPPMILPKEPTSFPADLSTETVPEVADEKISKAIEDQIIEISDRYIGELVVGVEQKPGRMKVTLSNDWYRFKAEQQDSLANELWTRSQTLNMPELIMVDPRGILLARPPIVGESMIVLKRKSPIA